MPDLTTRLMEVARDLEYREPEQSRRLIELCVEVSRMEVMLNELVDDAMRDARAVRELSRE